MKITEEFLYFVWQNQLFDQNRLTSAGDSLKIIDTGKRNPYSGPDFSFSKIKIADTTWVGNIEIHVKSSDWYKHHHEKDDAFNNVILHVIYEDDLPYDQKMPRPLELKNLILPSIVKNYASIKANKSWLPCESLIDFRDSLKTDLWLERVCIERLERKVTELESIYTSLNKDLEQTFFVLLGKAIGQKANSTAFEFLTRQTPLKLILKYADKPETVEALLMGQAGFLDEPKDLYHAQQKKEYEFIKLKHQLTNISKSVWKTGGVRPYNQPTIRIAQFSRLLIKLFPFAEKVEKFELKQLQKALRIGTSSYWNSHFVFGKETNNSKKILGKSAIDSILINAVIPFLFFSGEKIQNEKLKDKAISFLEKISPEKNTVMSKWSSFGINASSALFSQALLEQHNNYCKKLACLNCGIGDQIIKRK